MDFDKTGQVEAGERLACPHCAKMQESTVDEYVVPGRVGPSSVAKDECEHCYKPFKVECISPGIFTVFR